MYVCVQIGLISVIDNSGSQVIHQYDIKNLNDVNYHHLMGVISIIHLHPTKGNEMFNITSTMFQPLKLI